MKLKAWLVGIFDLKAEEETFSCDSRVHYNHYKAHHPRKHKVVFCKALFKKQKKEKQTDWFTNFIAWNFLDRVLGIVTISLTTPQNTMAFIWRKMTNQSNQWEADYKKCNVVHVWHISLAHDESW